MSGMTPDDATSVTTATTAGAQDKKKYGTKQKGSTECQKWTPVIRQRMDEYKCFLHHEHSAQRRNNEKTKTKPFI